MIDIPIKSTLSLWPKQLISAHPRRCVHRPAFDAASNAASDAASASASAATPTRTLAPYFSHHRSRRPAASQRQYNNAGTLFGFSHSFNPAYFHSSPSSLSSSSSSSSPSYEDTSAGLYKVLGVSPSATQKEIKAAYIAKSKLFHPDNNQGRESEAQDNFVKVAAAYKTLSSRTKRIDYDVDLENLWREIRNEAPLTPDEINFRVKDRGKYGFWNSVLPYGPEVSNGKFMAQAALMAILGCLTVFGVMNALGFVYQNILLYRRLTRSRKERRRKEELRRVVEEESG